jgi:hypothetical protein
MQRSAVRAKSECTILRRDRDALRISPIYILVQELLNRYGPMGPLIMSVQEYSARTVTAPTNDPGP